MAAGFESCSRQHTCMNLGKNISRKKGSKQQHTYIPSNSHSKCPLYSELIHYLYREKPQHLHIDSILTQKNIHSTDQTIPGFLQQFSTTVATKYRNYLFIIYISTTINPLTRHSVMINCTLPIKTYHNRTIKQGPFTDRNFSFSPLPIFTTNVFLPTTPTNDINRL